MNTNSNSASSSVFANCLAWPLSSSGHIIISPNKQKRRLSLLFMSMDDATTNAFSPSTQPSAVKKKNAEDHRIIVNRNEVVVHIGAEASDVDDPPRDIADQVAGDDCKNNKTAYLCRRSSVTFARELWGDMDADDEVSPEAFVELESKHRQVFTKANSNTCTFTTATSATHNTNTTAAANDSDEDEQLVGFKPIEETSADSAGRSTELSPPKSILRAKIDEMSRKLVQTMERTGNSRILVQNHVETKLPCPSRHDQMPTRIPAKKRRLLAEIEDGSASPEEGMWRHFAADFFSR